MTSVRCFLWSGAQIQSWFRQKLAQLKSAPRNGFVFDYRKRVTYPDVCVAYMMYATVPTTVPSSDGRVVRS